MCAYVCCIYKTQSHSRTQTYTAFCACGCTQDCLPMRLLPGISRPPFPDFTHSLTDSWFLSSIKSNTICNDRRGFEWKQNKPRPTSLRQGVGFPVYLHPIFDISPPLSPFVSVILRKQTKRVSGGKWREVDNTQVFITIICLFLTSHFSPSECAKHKTEILRPLLSFYVAPPSLVLTSALA